MSEAGRCVVLHQAVAPDAPADEQDVLHAAGAVALALREGGWDAEPLPATLDLGALAARLGRPALVFNLVEGLPGVASPGPLAAATAALLAGLGLRHTGSGFAALALTADKPATRRVLRAAGVPVPPGPEDGGSGPWIVKHATEHASAGLGPHSVTGTLPDPLPPGCYAEAFLPGREFNLSVLADARGAPEALPPAELVFADWPEGRPRILDWGGKWDPADPAYHRARREFAVEPALQRRLRRLALDCWDVLGLAGYARVDVRLDAAGRPAVVDVNANPCLAPDAGFAAAAAVAGLGYGATARRIAVAAGRSAAPAPLRRALRPADVAAIGALCEATGLFSAAELAVAVELPRERLGRGAASGYEFLLADGPDGALRGYACYGPAPLAAGAWDLYWIAVAPDAQGLGLGRRLADAAATAAGSAGGRRLYAETSGRDAYARTRGFYARAGFALHAVVPGFYAPGDDKQVWARDLGG